MLNIGNKVYRNMQEQVADNKDQIEKIFELLDGLNVQDNLIKLTASSGTLTAEEMAVVEKDVAFIIYNNNLYIKTTTSASEYTFKQVALSASDQGTYNILQSFRIVITRANGAYLYSSNTVLALYNKTEMDALLGAKADLAGADFTGDVTALKLSQSNANYTLDFNFSDQEGATIDNIYNRFEVINNVLYTIINMKLTNNGGSSISVYQISSGWKYIDNSVGNKIYDLEGKTVSESRTGSCLICAHEAIVSSNLNNAQYAGPNGMIYLENGANATVIILMCRWNSPLVIPAGESRWVTARLFLTLI